jgi:hypothetical protein
MNQPHITYRKDGSLAALDGREAVELMRVATIISGIKMNIKTGGKMQLTRSAIIGSLLKMAEPYTGQKYSSRKTADKQKAVSDLEVWLANMKSTIPSSTEK